MKPVCLLAIETSCDDTSLALVKNNKLVKESTKTSLGEHVKFGGIVPEIASRSHEDSIAKCLVDVFKRAKLNYKEITHVAYTAKPGLPGSLHVGKTFAKSIAYLTNAKLVPIDHMCGHIFSFCIGKKQKIKYPFLSLVVSGGHTSIYLVKSINEIKTLNKTTDDAVGETLDKIGRAINLPYPGGISIDKCFDQSKCNLKMINHLPLKQQFSFSGLKTHVLNYINSKKMKNQKIDKVMVASSSLEWICEELIRKLEYYSDKYKVNNIVIGGGVSANKRLRYLLSKRFKNLIIPNIKYCGDNATMIAAYALLLINDANLSVDCI